MVISQPPGNNPSYYYRVHQRCLNCSECFQRHLMFYTCNYNIRVNFRMVLLSIFFYNEQIHRIISRLFFIHFVAPCACSSSAKEHYFKSFCMKIWRRWFAYTSVYYPSKCQQDRTYMGKYYYENIPNIWHKSSTKHKEVRPDWNDKNDNANVMPRIDEAVLPMAQVAIFKEYSIKCGKDWSDRLFWTKTSQRLHYIYYLATDNIRDRVRKRYTK